MNFKRFTALLIAVIMAISCIPFTASAVTEDDFYELDYVFIGDEANVAGFAQGIITVTPNSTGAKSGYYLIYYTDGLKVLSGFDELASAKITGEPVKIEIKDGLMIPQGAKGIAVFESTTEFLDNAPDLSTAKARRIIPESKRLTLADPELIFGLASDVHVNYEYYDRGAYAKWTYALNFFNNNGAEYVFVAGDMTGDATDSNTMGTEYTLENQYKKYKELVDASPYSTDTVFECIGNHGNTNADNALFTQYTSGANEIHPYTNSPYFHVVIEGKTATAKDNVFIFMQQELDDGNGGYIAGNSAKIDNFSQAQIDWLEGLLTTYGNRSDTNVFIFEHSPFRNYGAGEKYNGNYSALVTFKSEFTQSMRLKALLETYKDVTVYSGHTHQTLYDNLNYSDMGNTFAKTVHVGSTCWPRAYSADGLYNNTGSDGRKTTGADYGSEAYLVKIFKEYTIYAGYNLSTGKIIPQACIITPNKNSGAPAPDAAFEGSGTAADPYLIQNESDFLVLTQGFNASTSSTESQMYGYGKYFKQTADIDMSFIESYIGTHANGDSKCYFAGDYNGNGYSITVNIKGPKQRSVFPYIYGAVYNVTIRGNITSEEAAQPIRTNRGAILNSVFDLNLAAEYTHGVVYSNYTYLFNIYTSGTLKPTGTDTTVTYAHPVANHDASDAYVGRVYHYYTNATGEAVADNVGLQTQNLTEVVNAFNIRNDSDYTGSAMFIESGVMSKAGIRIGRIALGQDGNVPAITQIPTGGNIAKYGSYTVSQLYRQGGADVDWGWDPTADIAYPDETGATLIDGNLASATSYSDGAWIGFHSKAPDYTSKGYHSITFTFDANVDIEKINIYVGTKDLQNGIDAPDSIEVLCDGTSVKTVNPTDTTTESGIATEKVVIDLYKNAKTVELRLKNYAWVFVSEVEIMAYTPAPHVCVGEGDWQSNATQHWKLCSCNEKTDIASHDDGEWSVKTPAQVGVKGEKERRCTVCNYLLETAEIEALTPDHSCTPISDKWQSDANNHWQECTCGKHLNENSHTAGNWVTVKEAEIGVEGKKEKRCTVCNYLIDEETIPALTDDETPDFVMGDINGNGKIDARDYLLLKRGYFGTYELSDIAKLAGDINGNGRIDARDYLLLKRAYFGTYTIQ